MAATGGTEEGLDWEFGVSKYKPVYRACIDSEVLLCGPEDYIQYPVINYNGKEYEKECACVCVYIYIYISGKTMAPHSSTLAWRIPGTKELGRLQSMGSLRVGHD